MKYTAPRPQYCPKCHVQHEGHRRGYCALCLKIYRKKLKYRKQIITSNEELSMWIRGLLGEAA